MTYDIFRCIMCSDVHQPHIQLTTNHKSTQLSPSIIGRWGCFIQPSSVHAQWADAYAAWLHHSIILRWVVIGETAEMMEQLTNKSVGLLLPSLSNRTVAGSVICHGIIAGNIVAKCRNLLKLPIADVRFDLKSKPDLQISRDSRSK